MEEWLQLVCSLFFPGLILFFLFHEIWVRVSALRRLARTYKGTVSYGLVNPTVRFQHNGVDISITSTVPVDETDTSFTVFQTVWPDRTFRCEVVAKNFQRRMALFRDTLLVEIGDKEFDRGYTIQANHESMVAEVLTPEVRGLVIKIKKLSNLGDVYVLWNAGGLMVKIQGGLLGFARGQLFTEWCLELFDAALATQSYGIDYLVEFSPTDSDGVTCLICGEGISTDKVYCRSCKTPHHQDCWEYFGTCSTYGCGHTDFSYETQEGKK